MTTEPSPNKNPNPWPTQDGEMSPVGRVTDALLHGNEAQSRIAKIGIEWLDMMLRKNADYGSAVWNKPILCCHLSAGDAILVRMSDKVQRIQTLLTQPANFASESFEDTLKDLGAYCLLYLARPKT
jgi:hypothetical protein